MRGAFRSLVLLSGATAVSIGIGLVSVKVRATLLGPEGLGVTALLQAILGLSMTIAAVGVGPAVIRQVADGRGAAAERDAAIRAAGWTIRFLLGAIAVISLIAFRNDVSAAVFGTTAFGSIVGQASLGLGFLLVTDLQSSVLNAYGRVEAQATLTAGGSILSAGAAILPIWWFGWQGIGAAVAVGSAVTCFVSSAVFYRQLGVGLRPVRLSEVAGEAWRLVRFGLPFTAGAMLTSAVQLAMPLLVEHRLGTRGVAFYQVAFTVAGTYLGFLIAAMIQDYYPRAAALRSDPEALNRLINEQHRLTMALTVPLILALVAISPWLVPLAYTVAFTAAIPVLQWQLVGDLFKFTSWSLAYALLARHGGLLYFTVEIAAVVIYLTSAWVAISYWGSVGIGVSWLILYATYTLIVWLVMARDTGFTWSRANVRLATMYAAGVGVSVVALVYLGAVVGGAVTLGIAILAAWVGAQVLRADLQIRSIADLRSVLRRSAAVGERE